MFEQTLTLICDGLMTFLLAIIALSLGAIVLTWLVGICVKAWCEVSRNFSRSIKKILLYLLCTLILSGYFAACLYNDIYYVGFKDTHCIQDAPAWIVQFHCYCEYSQQRADQVYLEALVMDAVS